ncbi:hypothetical protein [Photorhabdus luminescens]|uniref:hypothetical protein n=1 Tax=Photorhabdus luminescens TaxID=29488 RepID=UPI0030DBC551
MSIGRFCIKIDFHQFQAGITQRSGEVIPSSLLQQAPSKDVSQNQYCSTAKIKICEQKRQIAG